MISVVPVQSKTIQDYENEVKHSIRIIKDGVDRWKVYTSGNWPFQMQKINKLLDSINTFRTNKQHEIDTIVVGRNVYDYESIYNLLLSGNLKRIITQEDLMNKLTFGVSISTERTYNNKIAHPAIEKIKSYLKNRNLPWPKLDNLSSDLQTEEMKIKFADEFLDLKLLKEQYPNHFTNEYEPTIRLAEPLFNKDHINLVKTYGWIFTDLISNKVTPNSIDQKSFVDSIKADKMPKGTAARTWYRYIKRKELINK